MRFPRIYYGWVVLAVGFAIMLLGYAVRNTFTVFYPVIVEDFGWARGNTAIMYSLTMLSYGIVAPVAGGLIDKFNPKFVIAIGGLIVGGSIALCGLATQAWHFYILYGVVVAIGLSLIGFTPLSAIITHWFPHRKASVFGLLGAGFGISLVSAPLFQSLISQYGWRLSYGIIGAVAVLMILPLSLGFMRRSPDQYAPAADKPAGGDRPEPTLQQDQPGASARDWTLRTALRTNTFRVFLIISFCNMGIAQQIIIAHQVYLLQDMGYGPMVAATIFGVYGVSFAAGNLSSGLSDHVGRAQVFAPGTLLATAAVLMMLLVTDREAGMLLPVVFAIASGFGMGIAPPTCFAAVADRFHGRHYGAIQGTMILAGSLGGALGPWLGGFLHDISGSYQSTLIVVEAFLVASAILMWHLRPRKGAVTV